MRRVLRNPAVPLVAMALMLALLLSGLRGIWDPDEGRYTNVALQMLDSGDWLNPHRTDEVGHWTKPPLTYWAIAGAVQVFGRSAWAARLPAALSYLACIWLAWRLARRLAPGSERQAAAVFATMLLPFGAAELVTTDFPLTLFETLAMWGFVEARFGDADTRRARGWLALTWAAFGLAFLTKGPPGLLPLMALVAFDLATPSLQADGSRRVRLVQWWSLPLFLAIALPWYVAVVRTNPGLLDYFLGHEVVNRVASNEFNRHGEWYGWLQIYGPTLLVGSLPWTASLWRWVRDLPEPMRAWRTARGRQGDRAGLLLALWIALPLLVFCVARSRLPLYVLPLFVPLAVALARHRHAAGRALPRWRWLWLWAALLLGLELGAAFWPTHKDASEWARQIRLRVPGPISQVDIVDDMARYGIRLHLGAEVEKLSIDDPPQARFNPEYDEAVADELADDFDPDALWITKQARFEAVRRRLAALGYVTVVQGSPYQGRVLFRVRRAPRP